MIEDENMQKANRITVLRAKREYQRKKQARQQKQQQMQQPKPVNEDLIKKCIAIEETREKKGRTRSVVCVTTGDVFDSIKNAAKNYNIHANNIAQCCRGSIKHAGRLQDGQLLEWQYVTDYLNKNRIDSMPSDTISKTLYT